MRRPPIIAVRLILGLLVFGPFARFAVAQGPEPQPPAPPTPEPTVTTPGATTVTPVAPNVAELPPELLRRIEETDQLARITARKVEISEERAAAKAKEGAPSVSADEKGFVLRSADKRTFAQVRGLLQLDTRWFLGNDTVTNNVAFNDNDSFLIRRLRPEIGGTLVGLADFLFSPDFAGAATTVFDAFVDIHPFSWLRLRIGKQKTPLGLERLQSEGAFPFVERALDQNLTPGRDIGVALWGDLAGGIFQYNLGIWDGFPDNANNSGGASQDGDTNHAKDFIGRIFLQPLKAVDGAGTLGVGLAASTGERKGRPPVGGGLPLVPVYRSAGLVPGATGIFTYAAPAGDTTGALTVFAHLRETHLNPQLYYYYGPFGVLAEYVWAKQGVQKGNTTADLTNQAFHVSASYVIGGTVSYDGATPNHSFDPAAGHLGALEVAARYDALFIDGDTFDRSDPAGAGGGSYPRGFASPTIAISRAQGWTGALVYSPSRTLRFYANFEQTFFRDGGPADATTKLATDRRTENLLNARVHVKF